MRQETTTELKRMERLCDKFGAEDFTCFGQFSYDVIQTEKQSNKEIAKQLNQMGYLDDKGLPKIANLKFL